MPEDIFLGDDGESWLYRFPDELTEVLAQANEVALSKASVLWSATEELSCEPEDLVPVLKDLQSLAKRAMESGKSLYLGDAFKSTCLLPLSGRRTVHLGCAPAPCSSHEVLCMAEWRR
ncbi:hypothetical protein RRX38_01355 [Pseudomonas sp. DTU_2021_1001937_2_SI_NGA_ILE_001]|uniref:hypothetical protein n=1 Tax=Pseudomonas sp. DTU_2021_1001937_2_SI_NGA_ILE_001 TaxID=3077589 RepID=UPI0028FC24DD|nr:hypothetical protein [Pseudomonas sp. DTU_2021_1001937_2_SI_NGA_ILE_001]WNW09846.1 hypothetical protein RRX38_01355 [Pseudomonas sp. DTU_2021_1001937_2_SI_NGA_ILE_001]